MGIVGTIRCVARLLPTNTQQLKKVQYILDPVYELLSSTNEKFSANQRIANDEAVYIDQTLVTKEITEEDQQSDIQQEVIQIEMAGEMNEDLDHKPIEHHQDVFVIHANFVEKIIVEDQPPPDVQQVVIQVATEERNEEHDQQNLQHEVVALHPANSAKETIAAEDQNDQQANAQESPDDQALDEELTLLRLSTSNVDENVRNSILQLINDINTAKKDVDKNFLI